MTVEELQYFFGSASEIKIIPTPVELIDAIDKTLLQFQTWGLNPNKVSTSDFDVTTCVVSDPHHGAAKPRLYAAFMHLVTKKSQAFDIFLMINYGTYPTCVTLTQLAVPEPSDA